MQLTTYEELQSEIFTPITPEAVWTPLKKPVKDCVVGFASACGVHLKTQIPYKTSGDRSWRTVPKDVLPDEKSDKDSEMQRKSFVCSIWNIHDRMMLYN